MSWPPPDLIRAVGWTLVHFLWQGALIAAVLSLALRACATARTRHDLSFAALAAMAASPVATFLLVRADAPILLVVQAGAGEGERVASWHAPVVAIWAAGVAALAFRMAGGLWLIEKLRREAISLSPAWIERCRMLHARLPTALPVVFRQSREITGPMVVGWFKPVVLIPASAFLRMPANQLEAVVLHELAHVRRFDAFANLFQSLVETLLFYHPAVWWVGRRIRIEREHCCDDLAVDACGDRTAYVRALLTFETQRADLALAAGGSQVKVRATRLLGLAQGPEQAALPKLAALAVFAIAALAATAGADAEAAPDIPAAPAVMAAPSRVTLPRVDVPRAVVRLESAPAPLAPLPPSEALPAPVAPERIETTVTPSPVEPEAVNITLAEAVTPVRLAAPPPLQALATPVITPPVRPLSREELRRIQLQQMVNAPVAFMLRDADLTTREPMSEDAAARARIEQWQRELTAVRDKDLQFSKGGAWNPSAVVRSNGKPKP